MLQSVLPTCYLNVFSFQAVSLCTSLLGYFLYCHIYISSEINIMSSTSFTQHNTLYRKKWQSVTLSVKPLSAR